MRKSILFPLAWSLPLLLIAQSNASTRLSMTEEGKGIHWTTGLTWEQIKQKAKSENKYIFIDAYTTWCGPCKKMDKEVYPNDTVGDFFNKHFIAVKVQMDVTDRDDQNVKAWYKDASTIGTECLVTAYPSLIFLSPQGKIVQKEEGYRPVQQFVAIGKAALTPGSTYDDAYPQYKRFVNDYKQGVKHYDQIPYMIKVTRKLSDTAFSRQLFKEHLEYASRLNEDERYTKENIELWNSVVLKIESKALQFFIKDGDRIDQVMDQKGYSANVVSSTIQGRIVDSFFKMQKGVTTTVTGEKVANSAIMFMWLPVRKDGKIKPDYVEADWKTLKKMIQKYFSKDFTELNVSIAKVRWYLQHENKTSAAKTYFSQLDKFPPVDWASQFDGINQMAWETFLHANNKKLLKKALAWMDKIIQHGDNADGHFDTYANLLYKLGRTKKAIEWEEKAANSNSRSVYISRFGEKVPNRYLPVLQKMKNGEPTYLEEGAIWLK